MARSLADRLAAVERLREGPPDEARKELAKFLEQKSNLLVARAVEVAAELELVDRLFEKIEAAFWRFMERPAERDKSCRAKTAIVRALLESGRRADEIYLAGVEHAQPEWVWNATEDTAVDLRGLCGMALVEMGHPDAVDRLAVLLADPEKLARAHAARALGDTGKYAVLPLLKFKILIGDEEPEPITECFESYLRIAEADGLDFVASHLAGRGVTAECAALALGEARIAGSEGPLIEAARSEPQLERRRAFYVALSMLRNDAAKAFLRKIAEEDDRRGDREAAEQALAIFQNLETPSEEA